MAGSFMISKDDRKFTGLVSVSMSGSAFDIVYAEILEKLSERLGRDWVEETKEGVYVRMVCFQELPADQFVYAHSVLRDIYAKAPIHPILWAEIDTVFRSDARFSSSE